MFKKKLYILFILSFSSYAAASQLAITDGECGDYGAVVLYGDVVDDDSCDSIVPYEPQPRQQNYPGNFEGSFEDMRRACEWQLNNYWQNVIDAISQCKQAKNSDDAVQKLSKAYYSTERQRLSKSKFQDVITVTTEAYMKLIDVLSEVIKTKISDAIKDECIQYANFLFIYPVGVSKETIKIDPQYADSYVGKIIDIKIYLDSDRCQLDGGHRPIVDIPECLYEAYARTKYGEVDAVFQQWLKDYRKRQDELDRMQQENEYLKQQNEQLQNQCNNLLEHTDKRKGPIIAEVD